MFRQILRESKPSAQLLFSALVLITCGFIISALGMAFGWVIYGVNISEIEHLMSDLTNPRNISILKFFQMVQSIGIFIVPPFIIAWMINEKPLAYLKVLRRPDLISLIAVIGIVIFSNPLINSMNELNSKLSLPEWLNSVQLWMQNSEDQANKITEAFLTGNTLSTLTKNIFLIGILPAVGEELLFRGIVQQLFKKMYGNAHLAIWISAALFSALHLQFFGFLPRLVLGAMFGYMLEWSGTLWLPVIAHFINNASAVIAYYLTHQGVLKADLDKTGTMADGSFFLVIVSLIFLAVFFKTLYTRREIKLRI